MGKLFFFFKETNLCHLLNTYIVGSLIRLQSLSTKWFIMTTDIKKPINIPERFSVQSLVSLLAKKIYFALDYSFFLDKGSRKQNLSFPQHDPSVEFLPVAHLLAAHGAFVRGGVGGRWQPFCRVYSSEIGSACIPLTELKHMIKVRTAKPFQPGC